MQTTTRNYKHLLAPLSLDTITLTNRVLMGSMHTGLEDRFRAYHRLAAYFAERAEGGGPGLMVTGGISPNRSGRLHPGAAMLTSLYGVWKHRQITRAVHRYGGKICMQILHAGRYGHHPRIVSPSALQAPSNRFTPNALTAEGIQQQIADFIRCAKLARLAGYDGVEIMGSEGYFINQFLCLRTNHREDDWGGAFENRMRLAVEIVRRTRQMVGRRFIIIYRLSLIDLVEQGSTWDEVLVLAKAIQQAGATLLNCGIGWHEARIPTISSHVPIAAFSGAVAKLKAHVTIPVIATNRINHPDTAEKLLAEGVCDLVSMARPFLADAKFVQKTRAKKVTEINICIACNQACLDQVFAGRIAGCVVNPRAVHETKINYHPAKQPLRVLIIGAGPAGMSAALVAAQRGHQVTLMEQKAEIGGQFTMARQIPGKRDYQRTNDFFAVMLEKYHVNVQLNSAVTPTTLAPNWLTENFDAIVVSTGVSPRTIELPGGAEYPVLDYVDVLQHQHPVGERVAIIGAGGIGFDMASYLAGVPELSVPDWFQYWGIDSRFEQPGGLAKSTDSVNLTKAPPRRHITLLQRKEQQPGKSLGKTTSWVHRLHLNKQAVTLLWGVHYQAITAHGLEVTVAGKTTTIAADSVVVCAGQVENNELHHLLAKQLPHLQHHVIGGAYQAQALDAGRAIAHGARVGARL